MNIKTDEYLSINFDGINLMVKVNLKGMIEYILNHYGEVLNELPINDNFSKISDICEYLNQKGIEYKYFYSKDLDVFPDNNSLVIFKIEYYNYGVGRDFFSYYGNDIILVLGVNDEVQLIGVIPGEYRFSDIIHMLTSFYISFDDHIFEVTNIKGNEYVFCNLDTFGNECFKNTNNKYYEFIKLMKKYDEIDFYTDCSL